ncbi:serine-aspartate repeat adhesin O-glycosyltransferase SdgB [Staphylococcus petrasii]|uniref:serine-aspartate repeat adhesin O-glycosyltransferase SdgB n=1 Tax=Staphylococcus petrasii TaxID=1276936 RepID=UPI000CD26778|nr:glycosyltransferase [Staphylococcus petrasii]PNZ80345.1 glycosyl transferase family 1 [Staphylococcus petrasii]TGA82017.1 glycosyltransferase [Staphylococcus petrasii]SUM60836.1 putative glycosyltransferase [Staphylococcus petrasii]
MYYFVGYNLGSSITGIEKAMINRLKLFKESGKKAKCLFLSWNRFISKFSAQFMEKQDYINMYDYFQETISTVKVEHIDYITYWEHECNYTVKYVPNSKDIRVYDKNGIFLMYVRFFDSQRKQLDYINYFDINRRKIKREFYDVRGFLSCSRILTTNQAVLTEQYFNIKGEIVIEKFFNIETNDVERIILNYANKQRFFNDETSLQAYFFESIYQYGDLFFSDKNIHTSPAFNITNPNIPVIAVLHSTHVKNIDKVATSNYKNVYKELFNNLNRFKAIIVSTHSQKVDVSQRINNQIPVINIPVGFSEDHKINDSKKTPPKKLISVARYSPEKQLHQQIKLIDSLKAEFPEIQLHLYGFGSEYDKLKHLIKEKHLEENVFLRGFVTDLSKEYEDAYLGIITSNMEGFSLALLECQSYGVPIVSYDIKYGPNELVKDQVNGYLITKNDENKLTEKVRYLLNNPQIQQKFSQKSISLAQQYSKENIIEKWDNTLRFLNT